MHDVSILINITLALVVAFIGGIAARKLGLPTLVGYMVTGIVLGPFTPGIHGDASTIGQLAELGVIFLMFGVGLHFSLDDLWKVRDVAIPGALLNTLLASLLGFGLSRFWGWTISASVILGLAISVASTVVLLRNLMDNSLLNTSHGQAAVGLLVMEDILSVLILVLLPILNPGAGSFDWSSLILTIVKAALFVAIMFWGGSRIIPWLLEKIALTRSRELFILAILAITLGTAMAASEFFGVSLALGAFVAGAIISQSHLSHQINADVFPFREAFSVIFFVSIGMLVNPLFAYQHIGQILSLTAVVIFGKALIILLIGLIIPRPAKTFLTIAVGLGQIGEFSFIIGQAGLSLGMLTNNQYSIILATAILSISFNPLLFRLLPRIETALTKIPAFWQRLDKNIPLQEIDEESLTGHVIVIGYGRVGKHLVDVLTYLNKKVLVIESDAGRCAELNRLHIPTIYGEAGSADLLQHAHPEKARLVVVTLPDETTSMVVLPAIREINPRLPIIARAASQEGIRALTHLGADHIVHPELEGGLEIIHHALLSLGYPLREVHNYSEAIRHEQYDIDPALAEEHRSLSELVRAAEGIEVVWFDIPETSPLVGKSLAEMNIRAQTGASVVAINRQKKIIANPKSMTIFDPLDRIGLIGEKDQLALAGELISGQPSPTLVEGSA